MKADLKGLLQEQKRKVMNRIGNDDLVWTHNSQRFAWTTKNSAVVEMTAQVCTSRTVKRWGGSVCGKNWKRHPFMVTIHII